MKNKLTKLGAGICILSIFVIFYIYAENAFRVNAAGNVGIGIENATEKLEVDGNIKANGDIKADGRMHDKTGIVMPVATILSFAGPLNNIPAGWLACDGQSYPIDQNNEYWELYTAIGISWGGDAANFNVPDLRGLFLRGTDDMGTDEEAAGRDPDAESRVEIKSGGNNGNTVGSYQGDVFRRHNHGMYDSGGNSYRTYNWTGSKSSQGYAMQTMYAGGNETRPKNVYVNYIIKY